LDFYSVAHTGEKKSKKIFNNSKKALLPENV